MFKKIATFYVKFRWLIIFLCLIDIPVLNHYLPNINDVSKSDNSQFLPKNSNTEKAVNLEANFRGKSTSTEATLVASKGNQPLSASDNANIDKLIQVIRQDKSVGLVKDIGLSQDGQARQIFIGITGNSFGGKNAGDIVNQVRSQAKAYEINGLQLNLTGQLPQAVDSDKANSRGRNNTESF